MSIKQTNIIYDSKQNLIILTGREEPTDEKIKQSFIRVLELSEAKKCNKVLVDGRKTKKLPSALPLFLIGEFMLEHREKLLKLHIAYVMSKVTAEDFRFFENVSSNRGINIHSFNNLNEAKKWLQLL